ncbi:MAG TPA: hypothetical protein VLA36_05365 [Longimicrobiales bacterium]|nr:hypothetical protein [Longimicrobiales bacterium]
MSRAARALLLALLLPSVPVWGQGVPSGPVAHAFLFGDVMYVAGGEAPEGFKLGQTVIHGNVLLSNRVAFFGEASLTGRDTGYAIEIERAIIRYDVNDGFKISAGRYHTPISYWNTAFHHGLWLQGSVARPEAIKFGSRFIPVHFVGAMAEGRIASSPLTYAAGIGNGRAANTARAGDVGDVNESRAFFATAALQPDALPGFRVGGGVYFDDVETEAGGGADERITSGHAVWERGSLDLVGEYIQVRHQAGGSSSPVTSRAVYLHAGVKLPGELRAFMPYARWERMDIGKEDALFTGSVADYEAVLAGLRYDFSPYAALKIEYRDEQLDGASGVGRLFVQASYAAPITSG